MAVDRSSRGRLITYWIVTALVVLELALGGIWDLLRIHLVRAIVDHIGYPEYVLTILGTWKVAGAVAILVPRYPLVKEWAYAGAFFLYTGAVASHLLAGDGPDHWGGPAVFTLMVLASWALRPAIRRIDAAGTVEAVTSGRRHSSTL